MTNFATKALALGGLCALLLGAGHAASAQGYNASDAARPVDRHSDYGHRARRDNADAQPYDRSDANPHRGRARRHLQVLHAVYNHEIRSGHPAAAMQAHLRAKAIRAHIRARRADGG